MSNTKRVKELTKLIEEALANGKELKIAKALATIEGYKDKEIDGVVSKLGLKGKRANFIDDFYRYLAESPRTKEEVKAYVYGEDGFPETSANVKKSLNVYEGIRALTVTVYENATSTENNK